MSASTAPAGAPRVGQPRRRPRLQVIAPPPTSRSRGPFIVGCTLLLVVSLLGLLVLNISLSRGAYEVYDLQGRATALTEREQQLREELAARAAPSRLAQDARKLGMVPAGAPAFIRLSDGKVLGEPEPAPSVPAPSVVVGAPTKPQPTAQPEPTAQPTLQAAPTTESVPAISPAAPPQSGPAVRSATGDGAVPVTEPGDAAGG